MVCLGCGYALDGLRSVQCPECGLEFDPADPQTWRRVLHDGVVLLRCPLTDAHAKCIFLEARGVPALVHAETGGVVAYAPLPQGSLWVDRQDVERARTLIEAMNEQSEPDQHARPWTCPQCNELIEGAFDACWNCGAEHAAD